jgi:hypothetical protein
MKKIITLTTIALLAAGSAVAQTAQSGSQSQSGSSSSVSATTNSSGYAATGASSSSITFNTPGQTRSVARVQNDYNGDYTIRSAPAVQAPSMGSGHPCGLAGSIGISIIGGGAAGGQTTVDEACLLAQMGQGEAALLMIARRDASACKALMDVGRIPGPCVTRAEYERQQKAAATSSRSAPRQAVVERPFSRCELSGRGIEVRVARGFTREQAISACQTQLGY